MRALAVKRSLSLWKIVLLLCLLSVSLKAFAAEGDESRLRRNTSAPNLLQNPTGPLQRGGPISKDDELRRTLDLVRDLKLVKELSLSEDKASEVLNRLRKVREIQNNYTQRRQNTIAQLEKLVRSPNPELSELKAKLRELKEIETNYLTEKELTKKEIYELLSPQQRAQYILFQQKFQNELRRVISDIKKNNQAVNPPEGGTTIQRPREGTILQNRRR